jgi:hypothetical protein
MVVMRREEGFVFAAPQLARAGQRNLNLVGPLRW